MDSRKEDCVYRLKRLSMLLEQDIEDLHPFLKGNIFEAYRELVRSEMSILQEIEEKVRKY